MKGKIRTTDDLRKYLAEKELSPEQFAGQAKLSNMTIRRWLEKPGKFEVAEKYHLQLDRATGVPTTDLPESALALFGGEKGDFAPLLSQLEEDGKKYEDMKSLKKDTLEKCKDPNVGQQLKKSVKTVLEAVTMKGLPFRYKAIAVGALLYFINPIDLIPDATPVVGYLDDFVVLSLAAGLIARWQSEEAARGGK